jgi:hypothetical protein
VLESVIRCTYVKSCPYVCSKAKGKENTTTTTTTITDKRPKKKFIGAVEAQVEEASDNIPNKKRKLGWLIMIDKNNASSMFSDDGLKMLNALKGD